MYHLDVIHALEFKLSFIGLLFETSGPEIVICLLPRQHILKIRTNACNYAYVYNIL
jgi:hypothetical protein